MGSPLDNNEILATLRELNTGLSRPLWLFGGVAVDFMVGRWTRPHGDIDFNTLAEYRSQITWELRQLGYKSENKGWLTHWTQDKTERVIEVVFLERAPDGMAELVIREGDPIGIPGRTRTVPGYLDPNRFATLEDVRFRVSSPEGEWLARVGAFDVVGGRPHEPKLDHDRVLLEKILPRQTLDCIRLLDPRGLV